MRCVCVHHLKRTVTLKWKWRQQIKATIDVPHISLCSVMNIPLSPSHEMSFSRHVLFNNGRHVTQRNKKGPDWLQNKKMPLMTPRRNWVTGMTAGFKKALNKSIHIRGHLDAEELWRKILPSSHPIFYSTYSHEGGGGAGAYIRWLCGLKGSTPRSWNWEMTTLPPVPSETGLSSGPSAIICILVNAMNLRRRWLRPAD